MSKLIDTLVEDEMTLTTKGWTVATKLAERMPAELTVPAQWAVLFLASEGLKLDKDEDKCLFFLSMARKLYTGEIVRAAPIDVSDLL